MSGGGQECTHKDLRGLFVIFLVVWIYSTVIFCHGLNKQFRWERTTGTVVGLRKFSHPKGSTYCSPEISFQPQDSDEGENYEEVTIISAAEINCNAAEHDTDEGEYYVGRDDIVIVYNSKHPSSGPEVLEVNRRQLMFSGPVALFYTLLGIVLMVYFSFATDGGLTQQLGLGEHLAPEESQIDLPEQGAAGAVVV